MEQQHFELFTLLLKKRSKVFPKMIIYTNNLWRKYFVICLNHYQIFFFSFFVSLRVSEAYYKFVLWQMINWWIIQQDIREHPAGTSEISDWNGDITNFWHIEVNGRNFYGAFPLKNPQISQRSQHPFLKLVYSLKVLYVGICYQIIFKCNWARNQRKLQFCLTTSFLSISNSDMCTQTGLNQFKLVFSISNFWPS